MFEDEANDRPPPTEEDDVFGSSGRRAEADGEVEGRDEGKQSDDEYYDDADADEDDDTRLRHLDRPYSEYEHEEGEDEIEGEGEQPTMLELLDEVSLTLRLICVIWN